MLISSIEQLLGLIEWRPIEKVWCLWWRMVKALAFWNSSPEWNIWHRSKAALSQYDLYTNEPSIKKISPQSYWLIQATSDADDCIDDDLLMGTDKLREEGVGWGGGRREKVTSQTFSSSKVVEPAPALILNSINIETVRKTKAVRMEIGWRLYKR
jgi:hypothetical protein